MHYIEKASAKVNELVQGGMELSEAIKEVASEFGLFEAELWDEYNVK